MFWRQVEHKQDIKQQRGARGGGMLGAAGGSRRRNGRKQKVSSGHDVSSKDYGISASRYTSLLID